jgi:sulfur-oxidizing protein SoxY
MAMKANRRNFLKTTFALSATLIALLQSRQAFSAWQAANFAPDTFDAAMKQLFKGKPIVDSDDINLIIPEIAENGALVPVTVSTNLKDIRHIAILVEQNPVPLIIQIQLTPEIEPTLSTRLKLASSSFVYAIAEGEKACYSVRKKVKVTIGGCGG